MLMITKRNTVIQTDKGLVRLEKGKLARVKKEKDDIFIECTVTKDGSPTVTKTEKYKIDERQLKDFSKQGESFNAVAQKRLELIGNQIIEKGQTIELNVDIRYFKSIYKQFSMTEVNFLFNSIPTKINI